MPATPLSREGHAALRPVVVAAIVLTTCDAAVLVLRIGGEMATGAIDAACVIAAGALGAWLTAGRARTENDRTKRLGWWCLAVSAGLFVAGVAFAVGHLIVLGRVPPVPSPADAAYFVDDGFQLVAMLLLAGPMWRRSRLRLALDGGIAGAAVLLVVWLTTLRAVYQAGGPDAAVLATNLAYPIGDAASVVMILSVLSHSRRLDASLLMVAAGVMVFGFSDTLFLYLGDLRRPSLTDVGYLAGYMVIAAAARLRGSPAPAAGHGELARWQVVLPYVPLVLATPLVVANSLGQHRLDLFSEAVLAALVTLILARQLLTVGESRSLAATLHSTMAAMAKTSAERAILIEQAPVGICLVDGRGRILEANRRLQAMLGYSRDELLSRAYMSLMHPADRDGHVEAGRALVARGGVDSLAAECRLTRGDGTTLWCSQVASVVRGEAGRPESFITILEDVTDRRRQAQRAIHIQRQLLPRSTPALDGYELAGACLPAEDVAGDFYDWVVVDGCLDLTVADVMGKGVGAALVMAVLRTALRAPAPTIGPAARVRSAAGMMDFGMEDEGLFVTLFHARLDTASGLLRYVDAGHGHCEILRRDRQVTTLPERSLPLGVSSEEPVREGVVALHPGDALIACSDGLLEADGRTVRLWDFAPGLDPADGAERLLRSLMTPVPPRPADDVTVVVLRRLTAAS
jgi:PAS domain S-box-containing protein